MDHEPPLEQRYRVLAEIARASHFTWREAVRRRCPETDPREVVLEMWEITGVRTAEAYLRRLDPEGDVARQVAASIVWSSRCMGEDARLLPGEREGEWLVRHDACPWHRWHEEQGLLDEDRPGCDRWFQTVVRTVNERLGTRLSVETLSALPDGDGCCLRLIRNHP